MFSTVLFPIDQSREALETAGKALELAKSIPHGSTLVEKQLHMVAFLLENFDDLMIEPKYNVSESSGWDPFMRGRGPGGSSGAESRRLFSPDMH